MFSACCCSWLWVLNFDSFVTPSTRRATSAPKRSSMSVRPYSVSSGTSWRSAASTAIGSIPSSARIWAEAIGWVTYGSPVARRWPAWASTARSKAPSTGAEVGLRVVPADRLDEARLQRLEIGLQRCRRGRRPARRPAWANRLCPARRPGPGRRRRAARGSRRRIVGIGRGAWLGHRPKNSSGRRPGRSGGRTSPSARRRRGSNARPSGARAADAARRRAASAAEQGHGVERPVDPEAGGVDSHGAEPEREAGIERQDRRGPEAVWRAIAPEPSSTRRPSIDRTARADPERVGRHQGHGFDGGPELALERPLDDASRRPRVDLITAGAAVAGAVDRRSSAVASVRRSSAAPRPSIRPRDRGRRSGRRRRRRSRTRSRRGRVERPEVDVVAADLDPVRPAEEELRRRVRRGRDGPRQRRGSRRPRAPPAITADGQRAGAPNQATAPRTAAARSTTNRQPRIVRRPAPGSSAKPSAARAARAVARSS